MAPRIVPYFPDESGEMYEDYYANQVGEGMSVYRGKPIMTGNGIGSLFSGLARGVLPMLKNGAKTIGKKLLTTGASVLGDVIKGENFKSSAAKRFREAGGDLLGDVEDELREPPAKRARVSQKSTKKKRKGRKTVFD